MKKSIAKNRKQKKSKAFDPNRDYLNSAVKDYLQRGGKIKKIIDVEDGDPIGHLDGGRLPVDQFLMGQ